MASSLLEEAIAAHGGMERWRSLTALEAVVSADGWLFRLKRRPRLVQQVVRLTTAEPHVWFANFPRQGWTGEFAGDREVSIRDEGGRVVQQRAHPRSFFKGPRKPAWDDLDFLYFSGYALWNYFTTPFVFTRPGFRVETLPAVPTAIGPCRRLRVHFPPDVPTHSPTQVFYFDERAHLVRLDYTADIVGRWARGAHVCGGHRVFAGLQIPTVRRVTGRLFGAPMPGPTVVALAIHDVRALDGEVGG